MFVGCKGDANCWKRDKTNDDLSGTFVESYLKEAFSGPFRLDLGFTCIRMVTRQIPS